MGDGVAGEVGGWWEERGEQSLWVIIMTLAFV